MIRDLAFIVPDDLTIALPSKAEGRFFVCLEGGISTRLYLKLLMLSQKWEDLSSIESIEAVKEIALTIIREDRRHKDITAAEVDEAISGFHALRELVTAVYGMIPDMLNQSGLEMPDLSAVDGGVSNEASDSDHEMMQDIAFVMRQTSQTLKDILDMPYVTFAALLRSLVIAEAMKNPDYREAIEKQQRVQQLKNGKTRHTRLDLEGLKRFGANL
ncbi:MAG: hypothetical protein E7425_07780 [Ruminococcaceae bacterium]|nr:hypothetical protein [Oscillospiraceae bacterium]